MKKLKVHWKKDFKTALCGLKIGLEGIKGEIYLLHFGDKLSNITCINCLKALDKKYGV